MVNMFIYESQILQSEIPYVFWERELPIPSDTSDLDI